MSLFANSAINRLTLHSAFYTFSDNVGYVFIYVYLYKAGFGVPLIFCSIAASVMCRFVSRLSVVPVVRRIGIRNGLILGTALDSTGYLILMFVTQPGPLFYFAVPYAAFGNAYYWTCYHGMMARLGDEGSRGRQVSVIQALNALTGIVAPLLGTFLILTWGAAAAFVTASLVCAAGILPLLGMPNPQIAPDAKLDRTAIRLATRTFFADGIISATTVQIWFIALFTAVGESFGAYGTALALAGLAGAAMGLGVGRMFDLGHYRRAFLIAYALVAVVVLTKAFGSLNGVGAVIANALGALVGPLYLSAVNSRIYNAAKQSACALRFHVYAEGAWDIGAAGCCLTAALLAWFGLPLYWPMLLGLVGCTLGYVTLSGSVEPGAQKAEPSRLV